MVNYGRVQFVSFELGQTSMTLIRNRLHAWKYFLVAPQKKTKRCVPNEHSVLFFTSQLRNTLCFGRDMKFRKICETSI